MSTASEELTLHGAIDLFVHCAPCLMPRIGTDLAMAREAKAAGMRALVTASHHESTAGRASLVNSELDGFTCYGGISLNGYVGGLNPQAAEGCLAAGGKFVWMPTLDSLAHAEAMGGSGHTAKGRVAGGGRTAGIRIIGDDGALKPEVKEVVQLCRQYGGILGSGHTGQAEVGALVKEATTYGVPIVVNHPFFVLTAPLSFYGEMAKLGAWIELSAILLLASPPYANLQDFLGLIEAVGPERCVFGTDAGSQRHPRPTESLRVFAHRLAVAGVGFKPISRMLSDNPAQMLQLT